MQGLKNLGSTCAINSLIQIICRNKFLRESILNEDIPENTLSIELKEILKILYIDKNSVSPNKFINALYIYLDNFQYGEQIDITELWFILYDKIANEIFKSTSKLPYFKEYDDMTLNNPNINNKADYIISTLNDNKTSNWLKNTQGVILNIIQCNNCNYISYNFEPFNAIQLDLPDNNNDTITLTTLLRNYLKSSINKDEWKCEKCNKCSFYTKSHKLWKLPNVLIFLIKRYVDINKKNAKPIDINKNINIKKGCILSDDNLEASYNFSSIGMHIGNLDSGHYYAICKDESNNKFILYNDLNIRIYNEDNTKFLKKNNDAYMVVYSI